MLYHVVHALPGRLRVRQVGVVRVDFQGIDTRLTQIFGVHSVTASLRTGSLLIYYESKAAQGRHLCSP